MGEVTAILPECNMTSDLKKLEVMLGCQGDAVEFATV